jgi:hypothetical protein
LEPEEDLSTDLGLIEDII